MNHVPRDQRDEIEEILREIAADPDARLIRIPDAEDLLALGAQPKVGVYAPGLGAPERHLLQSHREELAFLLRERCVMALYADPRASLQWHHGLTVEQDCRVPEEGDWRRRASASMSIDLEDQRSRAVTDLLGRCVASTSKQDPDVGALAAASLRIAPSDEARLYLNLHAIAEGAHDDARTACREMLGHLTSDETASYCWEAIALSYFLESRYSQAADAYRRASESSTDRLGPLVCWLTSAMAAGDEESVNEADRRVDDRVPEGHRCVVDVERAVRARSQTGHRWPSTLTRLASATVHARRLFDAFMV